MVKHRGTKLIFFFPPSFLFLTHSLSFLPLASLSSLFFILPILLFSIIICSALHTKRLSRSLVASEMILDSRGRISPSIPFLSIKRLTNGFMDVLIVMRLNKQE